MEPRDSDWIVVRVDVAEHLVDALASFLDDEGVGTVVTGVREVADVAPPASSTERLEAHVPATRRDTLLPALERWLSSLARIEPAAAGARIATAPLPRIDWDAAFRRHHRPVTVGRRLLVAPPWEVPHAPGREVLIIEPGMAFGTGQHETTRTCLEEIEAAVAQGAPASALDVGTGTGVLALALARLGVPRVVGLDIDRAVLPVARENLVRNGCRGVGLVAGTVSALRARFEIVVANLLADVLIADAAALVAVLAAGGRLVVSGLLDAQVQSVAAAYAPLVVRTVRAEGPWRTLRLERP